ncbi:MAG: hypothetical protein FJ386_09375 [Verrucomicrobia bacterium]|nr:hypothetical protein [Verrucomicrobiota bacterium]
MKAVGASLFAVSLSIAAPAAPNQPGSTPDSRWFNTMVAHWTDYGTRDYVDFLAEARPEVAQVGFYGVTFFSLAHTPHHKGYPAHLPVRGTDECGRFFEDLNREIHSLGLRAVGHFNTTFIFGEHTNRAGFFEWYAKWDEPQLGPKPAADPVSMLQVDATGKVISTLSYRVGGWPEYHGCLNNPQWRACLKAMVKQAVTRGVDGLIANYFYRRDCMCAHCVGGFRAWLQTNYTAADLTAKLGIADLRTHRFADIPSWHDPNQTTPYKMAALRWTQEALKHDFDDVFIHYGRSLKPGLMVAQWNHLGAFSQINGDERSALPGGLWGRGEDYLWYSTGNAASQTDLANGDLGDGTLQLRYIRGAFGPKPFVLGKYEQTRLRAAIAEGIANGGAGMGFYANFKNPAGRSALVSYFDFARRHRDLYLGAQPAAELLVLYPRRAVHAGTVTPVEQFKRLGRQLVRDGFAFDVVPDDIVNTRDVLGRRALAWCDESAMDDNARSVIAGFRGVRLPVLSTNLPAVAATWGANELAGVTRREGHPTAVISLMRQPEPRRVLVHLVNYNRTEPPANARMGRGPQEENPMACEQVPVRLALGAGERVKSVRLLSPDSMAVPEKLPVKQSAGYASFTVPRVLVYAVARVDLEQASAPERR